MAVAALLAVLALAEAFLGTRVDQPWIVGGTMLAVAGALVLRRVAPLATLIVALVGLTVSVVYTQDGSAASVFGVVAASVNVGLELRPRGIVYGLLLVFGSTAVAGLSPIDETIKPIDVVAMTLLYGGAMGAGWMFRQRLEHAASLAAHASRLEQEREIRAREAVDAERARIARELHDIVSHSISVIVIQTQAVRRPKSDRATGVTAIARR